MRGFYATHPGSLHIATLHGSPILLEGSDPLWPSLISHTVFIRVLIYGVFITHATPLLPRPHGIWIRPRPHSSVASLTFLQVPSYLVTKFNGKCHSVSRQRGTFPCPIPAGRGPMCCEDTSRCWRSQLLLEASVSIASSTATDLKATLTLIRLRVYTYTGINLRTRKISKILCPRLNYTLTA